MSYCNQFVYHSVSDLYSSLHGNNMPPCNQFLMFKFLLNKKQLEHKTMFMCQIEMNIMTNHKYTKQTKVSCYSLIALKHHKAKIQPMLGCHIIKEDRMTS